MAMHDIEYGWCYTDHKDGKNIRPSYRSVDYVYGDGYYHITRKILSDLSLPMPSIDQVYRGTYNDLLPIDSHGLMVRVGKQMIEPYINPLIIQPIGWRSYEGITVSIYPGIELVKHKSKNKNNQILNDFQNNFNDLGYVCCDLRPDNFGYIRIAENDSKKESKVCLLLDTDKETVEIRGSSQRIVDKFNFHSTRLDNKADALATTIYQIYGYQDLTEPYIKAFEKHQPLRRMFWDACKGVDTDKEKLSDLWDVCAGSVNRKMKSTFPVWKKSFVSDDYERSEIAVTNLTLYSPWSGRANNLTRKHGGVPQPRY